MQFKTSVKGRLVNNVTYIARTEPLEEKEADMVINHDGLVYYLYLNDLSNRKIYKRLNKEIEILKNNRDSLIHRLHEGR